VSFFERPAHNGEDFEDDEDDLDSDEELAAIHLGGVVPTELMLARSETAAVALGSILAFPDGFEFNLHVWTRGRTVRRRRFGFSPVRLDLDDLEPDEPLPDELLRFGIEFPDGARVSNLDTPSWRLSPDATEPQHGMSSSSGGGSDRDYHSEWWAWPLPNDGLVGFVCEWPLHGIPETRVELDASLFQDAATRAQPVWSDATASRTHMTPWELSRVIRRRMLRDTGGDGVE
jgi:hypothetical protein